MVAIACWLAMTYNDKVESFGKSHTTPGVNVSFHWEPGLISRALKAMSCSRIWNTITTPMRTFSFPVWPIHREYVYESIKYITFKRCVSIWTHFWLKHVFLCKTEYNSSSTQCLGRHAITWTNDNLVHCDKLAVSDLNVVVKAGGWPEWTATIIRDN